jgi:hypothetical protein
MKTSIIVLLLFGGLSNCQSQTKADSEAQTTDSEAVFHENPPIKVEIHARVDTTNKEIKDIATLWTNYLNSEPDKISDNPCWNEAEKKRYQDFDLSRNSLFQFPSAQLLSHYQPKILSIEKEGDHYGIRTIYSAEGLEDEYRKSNPWAIQKLYAVKENNQWRLKNSLSIITAHWNRKTSGKITFIYPPSHPYSAELAEKASNFCNHITAEFGFAEWEPFDFYITQSSDELGRLLNFDFYFAGAAVGKAFNENRILLSSLGTEYYPHEFIHLILPKFERHNLIEEGFATWKGGSGQKTFEECAQRFANELSKNDTVTFSDVLNKTWGWQYAAFYTTGAILCHSAFEKGGAKLVNALLKIPRDDERLVDDLCVVLGRKKEDWDAFWRKETMKFKDN